MRKVALYVFIAAVIRVIGGLSLPTEAQKKCKNCSGDPQPCWACGLSTIEDPCSWVCLDVGSNGGFGGRSGCHITTCGCSVQGESC
jgi:hypothetical protein